MINIDEILEKNNVIIISKNELKSYFLNKKSLKPQLNFKFLSIEKVETALFGNFDNNSIKVLLKENKWSFNKINKYLGYIKKGINLKANKDIEEIYEILKNNDLIYIDESYKYLFKNKLVIFLGIPSNSLEANHIIDYVDIAKKDVLFISLNDLFIEKKDLKVTTFSTLDHSLHTLFNEIIALLNNNIEPRDIKIITDINNNYFYLDLFAKYLNIHLNFSNKKTLYDTKIAKEIEKDLENFDILKLDELFPNSIIKDKIKEVLTFYDFSNLIDKNTNYKEILSSIKLNDEDNIEGIKVSDTLEYANGKYIFILGFDNDIYIRNFKNNDLLDDASKIKNGIDSSDLNNKIYSDLYDNFLNLDNYLNLYFYETFAGKKKEISYFFTKRYNENELKKYLIHPLDIKKDYNKIIAKTYYSYFKELHDNYHEDTLSYHLYNNYFHKLDNYDNSFKKFDIKDKELFPLSYTQLDTFFKCPFLYFLTYILSIDEFEDTFNTLLGKLSHSILEHIYDKDFDFNLCYDKEIKEFNGLFSNKDLLILDKYKKILESASKFLINGSKNILNFNHYSEESIWVNTNINNIQFYGKVDSILESKDAIQVIDYKTGSTSISKTMIDYGQGLQLPIYAYLIMNSPLSGKLTLFSDMVVFSSYAMQVIMSFLMLAMIFMILPRASVSAKRINEVLDQKIDITDPEGRGATPQEVGTIKFNNVSFKYPDADEYILKNISFEVKKGETVAFLGSTGSGKSTLLNLVPRFYDATEGEVLVDGVNVKEYKQEDLHDLLGYVPQRAVLFKGTIKSNVSYGKSKKKITEEKIKEALHVAQADDFVLKLDGTYNHPISQGGTNVSGGQKQRLSIARAIARDPEIYLFDDSFSALDYKTDATLRKELKKYTKNATTLIVAQRIGTVMNADKILVLENGECVGMGTHKELLKTCEVYKQIALSQLSKEELENA